ncbi:PREDICTED: uncharacterized protein LOC109161697 [Ipomoea nil]|uniref:uncharacterized protein LOC109161697 n=1 Tax=Ipomoea nil TaxID=35883 RepID=UPI000900E682|nr:PREDICTED: uncharacterized protein LOC109161697 [Ipomoea nil]
MADPKTQLKRQREETQEEENSKRCKSSLNRIISILEDDEEADSKFNQDYLSPIFTSLQQELSSAAHDAGPDPGQQLGGPVGPAASKEDADADGVSVIRHLLEASDDELGIPSSGMDGGDNSDEKEMDGGDLTFSFCDDGLWEFEDEAADYYSSLQSELFM